MGWWSPRSEKNAKIAHITPLLEYIYASSGGRRTPSTSLKRVAGRPTPAAPIWLPPATPKRGRARARSPEQTTLAPHSSEDYRLMDECRKTQTIKKRTREFRWFGMWRIAAPLNPPTFFLLLFAMCAAKVSAGVTCNYVSPAYRDAIDTRRRARNKKSIRGGFAIGEKKCARAQVMILVIPPHPTFLCLSALRGFGKITQPTNTKKNQKSPLRGLDSLYVCTERYVDLAIELRVERGYTNIYDAMSAERWGLWVDCGSRTAREGALLSGVSWWVTAWIVWVAAQILWAHIVSIYKLFEGSLNWQSRGNNWMIFFVGKWMCNYEQLPRTLEWNIDFKAEFKHIYLTRTLHTANNT